jgi:hypothetical protein
MRRDVLNDAIWSCSSTPCRAEPDALSLHNEGSSSSLLLVESFRGIPTGSELMD